MGLTQIQRRPWFHAVHDGIPKFLEGQQDHQIPGYFRYSYTGDLFTHPSKTNLSGSIFALKLCALIDEPTPAVIQPIMERILTFQQFNGTFSDPFICRHRRLRSILSQLKQGQWPDFSNNTYIRAETRQTYSALLLHGVIPERIYTDIPTQPEEIKQFLSRLDWSHPWGAGSHFSHLLFFLSLLHQAGRLKEETYLQARCAATSFVDTLQHEADGAWYTGNPSHRQKVNGAMKVITGLLVDDLSFRYPQQLIDLCLQADTTTARDACDQINQVLVLRHSSRLLNSDYRQEDIRGFCERTLEDWKDYYYPSLGGFSFHKHRANDRYYGAKITRGHDEPDIHGTLMFTWGLSMMKHLIPLEGTDGLIEIKS
ncbi:MAG: hypothetical protein NUV84_04280 [Candidatus Uhrbacteria bacterium]|nr:hypothetical protein [Candidatus Uhrbacteria bacterium]